MSSVHRQSRQSKQSYQRCMQTELAQRSVTHQALLRDRHAAVPRVFCVLSEQLVQLSSSSSWWRLRLRAVLHRALQIQLFNGPMFHNVVAFSNVLLCHPKGVMWYVDVMLFLCACGSLLTLAWAQFPEETFPTHYWKTKVTTPPPSTS